MRKLTIREKTFTIAVFLDTFLLLGMIEAHILAIIILGVSSFIAGSIPLKLSRWTHPSFSLSLLLCLGGGVLLATSVFHMLGEVREKLPEYSELIFCCGFLFLYAVDEIIHLCVQDVHLHEQESKESSRKTSSRNSSISSDGFLRSRHDNHRNYGAIEKQSTSEELNSGPAALQEQPMGDHNTHYSLPLDNTSDGTESCCKKHKKERSFRRAAWKQNLKHLPKYEDIESSSDTSETISVGHTHVDHCHVEVEKPPCAKSISSLLGLLTALLLHAILEGCSIGVQTKSSEILLTLAAVACHKLVLAFCLGLELASAGYEGFKFVLAITAFSIGCPIGIEIGATITHSSDGVFFLEAPLQALAAGSLLYVAVFEVLPRERYKWQHRREHRFSGFFQMIFVLIGFTIIVVLGTFVDYHEHHEVVPNVSNNTYQPS